MRTIAWATSEPPTQVSPRARFTLRRRHPEFSYLGAGSEGDDIYQHGQWAETANDVPGTQVYHLDNGAPDTRRFGRFYVMGDSVTLSGGDVLRVVSSYAARISGSVPYGIAYERIASLADLLSLEYVNFNPVARDDTRPGLVSTGSNTARLFYIRASDSKLVYQDYSGSAWGAASAVANSPAFDYYGVGIAPVSATEGFVCYVENHTFVLHHWSGDSWDYTYLGPHIENRGANCHWFDAEILGSQRLVTFNINGTQYATFWDSNGCHDPWPVLRLDEEFGLAQTRICSLTKVDSRIVATAWTRFASSTGQYNVSYYHLVWTDDGYTWAIPEEGYIGQVPCRGKVHVLGGNSIVVGNNISYVGSAVTWLGGSVGTSTVLADNSTEWNCVGGQDEAGELSLVVRDTEGLDSALLTYGNEVILEYGEGTNTPAKIGTYSLDTPEYSLEARGSTRNVIARGPIKKLISYVTPVDEVIEGPRADLNDFKIGGAYARQGAWSHNEDGYVYCDLSGDDNYGLATVGTRYSGDFELHSRIRMTEWVSARQAAGVVWWYESDKSYWRASIEGDSIRVAHVSGDLITVYATSLVPGGWMPDAWYELLVRYVQGALSVYIRRDNDLWVQVAYIFGFSVDLVEPLFWYAGLYSKIATTEVVEKVETDTTDRIFASTKYFPPTGTLIVDDEKIVYTKASPTYFGKNPYDLMRGAKDTTISSHEKGAIARLENNRFESDWFHVFEIRRALSVADTCRHIITRCGVPVVESNEVTSTSTGATLTSVNSHNWLVEGSYADTFDLVFWSDDAYPAQTGINLHVTNLAATLSHKSSGAQITTKPISISSTGTFRCAARQDAIFLWINGVFAAAFEIPKTAKVWGCLSYSSASSMTVTLQELYEVADPVVWALRQPGRAILEQVLEGRDAHLIERSDGSLQVSLLENRDSLGSYSGDVFRQFSSGEADQDWASALLAYGGEEWVLVMEPDATRLKWEEWSTPYIYDAAALLTRASRRVRKMWASREITSFAGFFDPRMEPGDEFDVSALSGVETYVVSGYEIKGKPTRVEMIVRAYATETTIAAATFPVTVDKGRFG